MPAKKKSTKRQKLVSKIKVLKVAKPEPDVHLVDLQLEVRGADEPPALIDIEKAVEITPDDPAPQIAATGGWVKWLKSIW